MIGIILAAGKGSRLWPLTFATPKPLLPIGRQTVIDYVIKNLQKVKGLEKIVIAANPEENLKNFEDYFRLYQEKLPDEYENKYKVPIEIVGVKGWETGGDLKIVYLDKKEEIKDRVIVAFGDNITEINSENMLSYHKDKGAKITVALFRVPKEDINRMGIAVLDEDGYLRRFVEKPKEDIGSNLANAGYYIIEKEVLDEMPIYKEKFERITLPEYVEKGDVAGFEFNPKYWFDVGTTESYYKAMKLILEEKGIIPP